LHLSLLSPLPLPPFLIEERDREEEEDVDEQSLAWNNNQ
jgi:hypothetical protein